MLCNRQKEGRSKFFSKDLRSTDPPSLPLDSSEVTSPSFGRAVAVAGRSGAAIYLCKFPAAKIQPERKVSDGWAPFLRASSETPPRTKNCASDIMDYQAAAALIIKLWSIIFGK